MEKRDERDELDEHKPTCEGYGPDPERKHLGEEHEPPTCEGYVSEEAMRRYFDPWFGDRERRKKPRRRSTTRRGRKA